jgi:serine/threonine protein kinase
MTSVASSIAVALAERYRIKRELGAGGMATVYLASDLRHDRKVAIKVLKPELAAVLGAERFVIEIKTTASLQHPHILPLFDSGSIAGHPDGREAAGGPAFLYYVMPYIEGETVREKLNRETQFGVDDAIRIAHEVADALDYAHRRGVIHRDIKPENILLHDGRAMVMDFGIALAVSAAAGGRMTETGLSLGTPHYMSPEQATAEKDITPRSDIYSLASVLYEMLAGEPPHLGGSAQQIIMKIIAEPAKPVTSLRKSVPANVSAALDKALEKLAADRFESAKAFSDALANPSFVNTTPGVQRVSPTSAKRRGVRDAVFAIGGAAVVAALTYLMRPSPPAEPPLRRFQIELPDSITLPTDNNHGGVALSRDGDQLAFQCEKSGGRALCIRSMNDPAVQVVQGTAEATNPVFSPRGDWLLFQVGTTLKRIPVTGGSAQNVAQISGNSGASWGEDGRILYRRGDSLWLTNPEGTSPRLVTTRSARQTGPPGGIDRLELLPGGRCALVSLGADSVRLAMLALSDGSITELGIRGTAPHYASPGHLLFVRGGAAFVVPFSLRTGRVTGPATQLIESVRQVGGAGYDLSMAGDGTMAYVAGESALQSMYAVDRDGKERQLAGGQRAFREPRISPDGKRIVVRIGSRSTDGNLWIDDIESGALQRLTSDSMSFRADWSRDGSRIVYVNGGGTPVDSQFIMARPADGSGTPVRLAAGSRLAFYDFALGPPGGLSVVRRGGASRPQILLAPTDSLSAVRPFTTGTQTGLSSAISAHGRLIAYASDETGRSQVYVRQIPGPGPVVGVSVDGGSEPVWSADETTLFYRGPKRMMAATLTERPSLAVTKRDSLFVDIYRRYESHAAYDVFPNGREFLMTRAAGTTGSPLFVVLNWPRMIGRQTNGVSER